MSINRSTYLTLNSINSMMHSISIFNQAAFYNIGNPNDYIRELTRTINKFYQMVENCGNDLSSLNINNVNSISKSEISTIEEMYKYYYKNTFLSYNNKEYYESLKDSTEKKWKRVFSLEEFSTFSENSYKRFYKLNNVKKVNVKGILWNKKKTVQEYSIKNNDTIIYLVNLELCEYLIKTYGNSIIENIEKLEKLRREQLIKLKKINKEKYDLLSNEDQKLFKRNGNIFIKKN